MRSWAFCLLVALSAFGIGSIIAAEFCQQLLPNISNSHQPKILSRSYGDFRADLKGNTPPISVESENSNDYKCSGLDNEDFFETAINRWMKGKKLSNKPMRPPKEYQSDGDEFTASLIDVNNDGRKELLIKAYCSPIKNCQFYIYEKQGNEYRRLFMSETGIQAMSFEKTSSKNYLDIRVKTKLNEKYGFYSTYKFDQGKFKGIYDTTECTKYEINKIGREKATPIECYLVEDDDQ